MYRPIAVAVVVVAAACAASAQEVLPNGPAPQAIEEVKSGARADANAAWWGFDAADATGALQAAIDSGAKTVRVPYMGRPWIIRPVKLRGDLELVFEPGVLVLAKEGEFRGKGDSLFTAADVSNVAVRGYGATLRMRKKDYQNPPYDKAEWRMGLAFRGCEGVTVEGLRIESTGGDGIYIGATAGRPYCKDVVIRDVACIDNHRQGISVISAENLLIEDCVMSDTGGTAPQAGIDFEPNGPEERLVNCVMRRCLVENNAGDGIVLYLRPLSGESAPLSITVEDCVVRGGQRVGIDVVAIDDGPAGAVEFRNCVVENPARACAGISDKAADAARVRFVNCHFNGAWANAEAQAGAPRPAIALDVSKRAAGAVPGGVEFVDCHVYGGAGGPAVAYLQDAGEPDLRDVTGTVIVHGTPEPQAALGGGAVDLRVVSPSQAPPQAP